MAPRTFNYQLIPKTCVCRFNKKKKKKKKSPNVQKRNLILERKYHFSPIKNNDAEHLLFTIIVDPRCLKPGRVAQSVGHLTRKSGVLGLIPGLATNFRFSFR